MKAAPEWVRSNSGEGGSNGGSNGGGSKPAAASTNNPSKKFQFAEYRYGREELLHLFSEGIHMPPEMTNMPQITQTQPLMPLSSMLLTEDEQLALSTGVNSETAQALSSPQGWAPYRGGGGRGGRGRGRDGSHYRNSNSSYEDAVDRGWGGGGDGGGPQAAKGKSSRDGNWRSHSQSEDDQDKERWQTVPSHSDKHHHREWKNPKKETREKDNRWLPTWATEGGKAEPDQSKKSQATSEPTESKPNKAPSAEKHKHSSEKGADLPSPEEPTKQTSANGSSGTESQAKHPNRQAPPTSAEPAHTQPVSSVRTMGPSPTAAEMPLSVPPRITSPDSVFLASGSGEEEDPMVAAHLEKAAEALLSTEEDEVPNIRPVASTLPLSSQPQPQPSSVQSPDLTDKWYYIDPQGETQGPFPTEDMKEWHDAGYFTADLRVRRVCDAFMLSLGQLGQLWGFFPFSPSCQQQPPVQISEPWIQQQQHYIQRQAMFGQQYPLLVQSVLTPPPQPPPAENAWSTRQKVTNMPPAAVSQQDQWPDVSAVPENIWDLPAAKPPASSGHSGKPLGDQASREHQKALSVAKLEEKMMKEEDQKELKRRKEEERLEKEDLRRKEAEERTRQLEEAKKREVEERARQVEEARHKEAEEKARQVEEARKREAEERARQVEEAKRKEAEARARQLEEARRKEEEEIKAAAALEKQRQAEEQKRRLEEMKRLKLKEQKEKQEEEKRLLQRMEEEEERGVWTQPQTKKATSLRKIQLEEEAVEEQQLQQEVQVKQQQLQQQQQQQQPGWKSVTAKPKSFLEIQEEQQKDPAARKSKNSSNWSGVTGAKQAPPSWTPQGSLQSAGITKFIDDEDMSASSAAFWEDCAKKVPPSAPKATSTAAQGAKKAQVEHVSRSKTSGNTGGPSKRATAEKDEDKLRRLFAVNASPSAEFNSWCEQELKKFNTALDVDAFISIFSAMDSPQEMLDYIKSFLGDSRDVLSFARQFVEKQQKLKVPPPQISLSRASRPQDKSSTTTSSQPSTVEALSPAQAEPTKPEDFRQAAEAGEEEKGKGGGKKKKKGKMQKVNPSDLLRFTVNAPDRPNLGGEMHSVRDAV